MSANGFYFSLDWKVFEWTSEYFSITMTHRNEKRSRLYFTIPLMQCREISFWISPSLSAIVKENWFNNLGVVLSLVSEDTTSNYLLVTGVRKLFFSRLQCYWEVSLFLVKLQVLYPLHLVYTLYLLWVRLCRYLRGQVVTVSCWELAVGCFCESNCLEEEERYSDWLWVASIHQSVQIGIFGDFDAFVYHETR